APGILPTPEPLFLVIDEEGADVERPARIATDAEVQSIRDLPPQRRPGRGDVAGPGDGAVALLAGVSAARQIDHALGGCGLSLVLVDPLAVVHGIDIDLLGVDVDLRFVR